MEGTEKKEEFSLDTLKVSNLPELQGWKEKQEQLVKDNPYVEISDNKTYDVACKNRTALLKGRTELEKQDKLIASKLASFRKDVKTETDKLIEITKPHEEKQQEEVKRFEKIKEEEKAEKERLEKERVDKINSAIDSFETDSYLLIQKMTFETKDSVKAELNKLANSEFDYEEFDILFEQAKARVENSFAEKVESVNKTEAQRVETELANKRAEEEKRKNELQSSRLKEILPYNQFGVEIDITSLWSLADGEYQIILQEKKVFFDKNNQELEKERLEKEESDKQKQNNIFDIRKNRLIKLGCDFESENFSHKKSNSISADEIKQMDVIDFETYISELEILIETPDEVEETIVVETEIVSEQVKESADEVFEKEQIISVLTNTDDSLITSSEVVFQQVEEVETKPIDKLSETKFLLDGIKKLKDVFISEIVFSEFTNPELEVIRKEFESDFDSLIKTTLTKIKKS